MTDTHTRTTLTTKNRTPTATIQINTLPRIEGSVNFVLMTYTFAKNVSHVNRARVCAGS